MPDCDVIDKDREAVTALGGALTGTDTAERADVAESNRLDRVVAVAGARFDHLSLHLNRLQARLGELTRNAALYSVVAFQAEVATLDMEVADARGQLYEIVATAAVGNHTAADVAAWVDWAKTLGNAPPKLTKALVEDLARCRKVPNAAFRALFLELEERESTEALIPRIARAAQTKLTEMGVQATTLAPGDAQVSNFLRVLGLRPTSNPPSPSHPTGRLSVRLFISYEMAVALAAGFGRDPHTFGI